MKINQILVGHPETIEFFSDAEVFAKASIDINGNICRLVIDSVSILKENRIFASAYLDKILQFINESFEELDKFIFRDKKYMINKQLFKLYWSLDALKLFANDLQPQILLSILDRASKEREYTIREKAAQIVLLNNSEQFFNIKKMLEMDENYYVRNVFKLRH